MTEKLETLQGKARHPKRKWLSEAPNDPQERLSRSGRSRVKPGPACRSGNRISMPCAVRVVQVTESFPDVASDLLDFLRHPRLASELLFQSRRERQENIRRWR